MLFLNPIDLNQNELKNVRIHVLATAPENPVEGQVYFNNATAGKHFLAIYQNGAWNKYYVAAETDALLDQKQDNLVLDASLLFDEEGKLGINGAYVSVVDMTFENKHISADANAISDLETDNFKTGVVQTTVRGIDSASDEALASEKAIRAAINNADTRVDDETIEKIGSGDTSYIQLKDAGITLPKMNAAAVQLGEDEAQANAKLASKAYVDESIEAERSATATLTNHTIDADNNTVANLETDNFKSGVIQTTVRQASSASDSALASEKAVATLVEGAVSDLTLAGVAPIVIDYTEKEVSINYATTTSDGSVQLATAAELAAGTDEAHALTSKITKAYIDERLTNAVLYRGVWNCEGATDYSALNSFRPMKKGDFFAVNGSCTIDGVEYKTGDHIIFNKICGAEETIVTSMIDKIDSTEASDIVRLDATQTLTNKTIDSDSNTIANLVATDFKAGRVQVGGSEATVSDDTVFAAKSYVDAQISGGETHADEVTIHAEKLEGETWQTFSVKDAGLTFAKFNSNAIVDSTAGINKTVASASDVKLPTEKAVSKLRDEFLSDSVTLTNKAIDADNNTISNLEVDNLKAGVLATEISSASTDAELASAKAVQDALDALDATLPHKLTVKNPALTPISGQVSWTINHSFGEKSMNFSMIRVADGQMVCVDYAVSASAVTITFPAAAAVAADTYQVTLIG